MRIAGIPGVLICTVGCIIPSFCICLTLAHFYYKYRTVSGVQVVLGSLRPAVVALIASAGASILMLGFVSRQSWGYHTARGPCGRAGDFVLSLVILRKFKVSAITIILGSGVVGTAVYTLMGAVG